MGKELLSSFLLFMKKEIFFRKSNIILMVVESICFAVFSHAVFEYYDLSLDLMNQYPFREAIVMFLALVMGCLFAIIGIVWMVLSIRKKEFLAFIVMLLTVLFMGLFLLEPFVSILDYFVTSLFHLVPETIQNQFVRLTQLLKRWIISLT